MISKSMVSYVENSSVIRAMFEEGQKMAKKYGAENVFDFSLGNPNVPAPEAYKNAMISLFNEMDPVVLHGYMSNSGFESVRSAIAENLNKKHGTAFTADNIMMTVGAAGGLNVILKTLLDPGDEVLTFAPFFGEYRNYVANYQGTLHAVAPNCETFQPNLSEFENMITAKTKAVIINSPNNPTGVVYSAETLKNMAAILEKKQKEFSTDIYIIADEPYRELVYGDVEVPYVTKFYNNTVVGYSFSKSLSLPGERIGYLVMPDELSDSRRIKDAAAVAGRILGFVNAPSAQQLAVAKCLDESTDIEYYNRNREKMYGELTRLGFSCIKPEGAFYLFIKSPVANESEFCAEAKKLNILIVPGSSFGCGGYVRLAYCVSYETVCNSIPAFEKLAKLYFKFHL